MLSISRGEKWLPDHPERTLITRRYLSYRQAIVRDALGQAGLPVDAVELLSGGREELAELATQDDLVDLLIPRGGEGLKAALKEVATVP